MNDRGSWYSTAALGLAGLAAFWVDAKLAVIMLSLTAISVIAKLGSSRFQVHHFHPNAIGAIVWLGLAIPAAAYLLYATAAGGVDDEGNRVLVSMAGIAATGGGLLGIVSLVLWLRQRNQDKSNNDSGSAKTRR